VQLQTTASATNRHQPVGSGANLTTSVVETPEERLRRKIALGGISSDANTSGRSGMSPGTASDANTSGRSGLTELTETPEERLRRKIASGGYSSDANTSGRSGLSDSNGVAAYLDRQQRMGDKIQGGNGRNSDGVAAYLDQQQRMEEKIRGGSGGDLEDRVRAKAGRAAANTNASTGRNSTIYGAAASSRVNYLSPGVSDRIQAKAGAGRGGRGAKYDPRAEAVGAYAVAGTTRSESGRGRGRGRGQGRGRGGERGRSGRSGRGDRMPNGESPSILDRHTPGQNGRTSTDHSTIATNTRAPNDRDVFDNDHNDLEQARELTPEARGTKDGKKIFGLPRTTVCVVAFALLAAVGIAIGAAAGNGAFSSPAPAPTSQTQDALPPSPTVRPTLSPVARPLGPECQLNKISGPRSGASESTVAISDDITAIGSPGSGSSGSVSIFTKSADDTWSMKTNLSPSDGFDFGRSIDIQDGVLVVGATYVDEGGTKRGCGYVYELDETTGEWELLTRLVAEDAQTSDESFGSAVAVDFIMDDFNERRIQVLMGEPHGAFYQAGERTGSVHIFTDTFLGGWELQTRLFPSNGVDGDSFGLAVDLANSRAVVANANGSVYSFEQDVERFTRWRQRSIIPPVDDSKFVISGSSVSIHHRSVAVGSGGIVRIFDFGTADDSVMLRPSGGDLSSRSFGQDVAIKDDTVIVSAPQDGSAPSNGALIYIFGRDDKNRWGQVGMFESGDAGTQVAVDGSTVVVGSQEGGEAFVAELC